MKPAAYKPPRIALAFFRWFCNPNYREEIEGDLIEQFHRNAEELGRGKADWLFTKEVLLLFRPAIIGNMKHLTHKNLIIMSLQNKRLLLILVAIPSLLLVPLIAMQFTTTVNWKIFDFIIMGGLLLGTGLVCELVLRKVKSAKGRIILCGMVILVFVLIWAELAVGLFGTAIAGS